MPSFWYSPTRAEELRQLQGGHSAVEVAKAPPLIPNLMIEFTDMTKGAEKPFADAKLVATIDNGQFLAIRFVETDAEARARSFAGAGFPKRPTSAPKPSELMLAAD